MLTERNFANSIDLRPRSEGIALLPVLGSRVV